jgi:hypothetical protein
MYALANTGTLAGGSSVTGEPASYPYLGTSALNDVLAGSNGSCRGSYLCAAGPGYDGPTGLGTPNTDAAFSATPPPPPVPTAPSSPLGLTAVAGDGTVHLAWAPPASSGGSAVSYLVRRATVSGGEGGESGVSLQATGVSGTAYDDRGLTNGVTYYYQVQATNAVGPGPFSNEAAATPAKPTVLGPPTNLVATTAAARGVALTWNAPATTGGSPITSYKLYRSLSPGAETLYKTVACTASGCAFTDVATHRAPYYYQVAAVTAKGVGPLSNEASALAR